VTTPIEGAQKCTWKYNWSYLSEILHIASL